MPERRTRSTRSAFASDFARTLHVPAPRSTGPAVRTLQPCGTATTTGGRTPGPCRCSCSRCAWKRYLEAKYARNPHPHEPVDRS